MTAHFSAGMSDARGKQRSERQTSAADTGISQRQNGSVPAQVFLTHLHSDHIADLATFYVGAMFGRTQPWHVWGPSGENATTGTAHSIEGLRQVMRRPQCHDRAVPKQHICWQYAQLRGGVADPCCWLAHT